MDEEQLNRLQKANGTKTARAIVRGCYPSSVRMNFTPEDLESDFRFAIHGKFLLFFYLMYKKYICISDYIQLFHGMEGLTEGKINESINNVFRSAKSQKKEKAAKQQPLPLTDNSSKKINNKKICSSNDKENVRSSNK
jgi:hypothetical protein